MTFDDAMLWGEIEAACEGIGLSEQVTHFIGQAFEANSGWAKVQMERGGMEHYLRMELASLRGQGLIDESNVYIPGHPLVERAG
jgi:hypothetical protein